MEPIGVIFGRVDPDGFNLAASAANVQRNEYVQANHKMYGAVVGQVLSIERRTDVSYEKAAQIVDGQNVQVAQQLIAYVDIIGYRDERGVLQRPRTPFQALPSTNVFDEPVNFDSFSSKPSVWQPSTGTRKPVSPSA